ncbi:MAG TPA: anion permease [Phycisphaerae bacterium]|jgi:PiT family inorganic phosphate transporter
MLIPIPLLAAVDAAAASASAAASSPAPRAALGLVITIIVIALVFDFFNGFHDAANSIATIVSTRVLSPSQAVVWAAFFNFVAAFVFGTKVSETISDKLVDPNVVDVYVVFGGLIGAIAWNIITWLLALPTSSSHALFGGIAGAAITKSGIGVLILPGKWLGIVIFIFLGPIIGMITGMFLMVAVSWIFRFSTPSRVDSWFRRLQLLSAAVFSLSHGGNDAQKTMGVIKMLLVAAGLRVWADADPNSKLNFINVMGHHHTVAWWIILTCNGAIALGTCFGGWRIVKTMGTGITRLQPVGGFCAETAAAGTIIAATNLGIPISTTHAITGSILGVGTTKSPRAVRWIWGQRIVMAWVLTIPCSAFMAALAYLIVHLLSS